MPNVVVTGGSRGLGVAITAHLLEAGYQVTAVARHQGAVLDALHDRWGAALSFVPADLSCIQDLSALARRLRMHGPIYGLVNNAAIGTAGILATMPDGQIEQLMRMNVVSPITLTKYVVRGMLSARAGRVVNIASVVATTGYSGLAAYAASKAALIGFTRALARELGPVGVTVNAVAPGFVDTALTETIGASDRARIARRSAMQRLVRAEDVAAAVAYLLSECAGNVTGTVLTVDAGATA